MNKYLKQLLDALAQKNAEKQGIVTKALDAGQTPNEEEEKQIEGIDAEIATLEKNIARVKEMIKQAEEAGENGTPVAGGSPEEAANTAGGGNPAPRVEVESNLVDVVCILFNVSNESLCLVLRCFNCYNLTCFK